MVRLLNADALMTLRKAQKLPPAARWVLSFEGESLGEAERITRLYRQALDGEGPAAPEGAYTTGHYFRGVE